MEPELKLFVWTEHDWECCNHYFVFATTEEEAKRIVCDSIRAEWTREWITAEETESYVNAFLSDPNWKVECFDIKPGLAKDGIMLPMPSSEAPV